MNINEYTHQAIVADERLHQRDPQLQAGGTKQ